VCVTPHSKEMIQFEDKTYSIAKRYESKIKLTKFELVEDLPYYHSTTKAQLLNKMALQSEYYKPDSWIWILDVDEFYPRASLHSVKLLMDYGNCDQIGFEESYFYINMQHCLFGSHNRLFKIKKINMHKDNMFKPTQNWYGSVKITYVPRLAGGMFHYGMLTNPHAKFAFWNTEYPDKEQSNKVVWLDKIYRNYDLKDQNRWIGENEKLFGIRSPWFSDSFTPDKGDILYKFRGKHPWAIRDKGLEEIEDFRKRYNFE